MPFVITTYDKPNHTHVRDAIRPRHLEYLEANVAKVMVGGGFFDDAASGVIGGLLIINVDSREEAEQFIRDDPFSAGDLFARVEITRWKPSFFDYKRQLPAAPPRI